MQKIRPCLLFESEAEETARFCVSLIPNSQVVPTLLPELLADPDPEKSRRAMEAMLQMRKLEIAVLEQAAAGA